MQRIEIRLLEHEFPQETKVVHAEPKNSWFLWRPHNTVDLAVKLESCVSISNGRAT